MFTTIQEKIFIIFQKIGNSIFIYAPKKELLLEIRNKPLVKLFFKSIIIGSLLLIITKLLIGEYLNVWSRIMLLGLYIGIAMILELREKVKLPLAIFLQICLGFHFYTHSDDLEKWDYYIDALPEGIFTKEGARKILYTIKFELVWYMQYLFQRFYIFITYIRLFFDVNPIIYIISYYNILFIVIYYDSVNIMSYMGLFFICTRLLVYFSENNFTEVIKNLVQFGYNQKLITHKLKLNKKNVMLFLFWNIREIGILYFWNDFSKTRYDYNFWYIHNKCINLELISDTTFDLPFTYKIKKNIIFLMFPFVSFFQNIISDTRQVERINFIKAKNIPRGTTFTNSFFEIAAGHDALNQRLKVISKNNDSFYIYSISLLTSKLKERDYAVPLGAQNVAPHKNGIFGDFTVITPFCYWKEKTSIALNNMMSEIIFKTSPPKVFDSNSELTVNFEDAICLSEDISKMPLEKKMFLEETVKSALIIKLNPIFNPTGATFGQVFTYTINEETSKVKSCLDIIQEASNNYFDNVEKDAYIFCQQKGIQNPSTVDLKKYKPYEQAQKNKEQLVVMYEKQINLNKLLNHEISTTVVKTPPYNSNGDDVTPYE